ncbi:Gfo/Idh/MocA family oxidoreductase [Paenibacillus urinalis]|uniref:Gfo/Idh/MocA family oxidoreductase n=1 Tax=Paenibacillus urinalis TaxID=521520 RepID=A0ABY7X5G7_9BACL|nr:MULTISPECIES: Gfo/Idh/MocA family oxidoreductase [Paenibacillus]WDH97417.1 Gfo/Idh/MocA family oxidoreductase [Paenibacillus urinalis]WDI01083.1 Gfo/Idh/MocA family oxidoreductase [Paenibacillus urinalis]GAK39865.1 putative oxidoreductase [Paenibacillus sp. TCA20]
MTQTLKVAIIGCGGIANGKHMPSLSKQKNAEMVAFCDIVESRAEEAASKFGAEGAKVYTDYQELLKDKSIDIVHVCTPNDSHSVITVAALEAGKHVMCEKPMAKTSEQALEMIEAAKRTGKKLSIAYQNRFRNDSLYLKELIETGELGDIYYGKAIALRRRGVPTWGVFLDEEKQGGGPLIDIGTHALDLTLWLMDNYKPKSVMGSVFHKLSGRENAANAFGPWNPEEFNVEDSAFGFVTMENGATIQVEASWALNVVETGEAQTLLAGTEGGADMKNGLRLNGEKLSRLYEQNIDLNAGGVAFFAGESESDADREARMWIEAILEDKEPLVKPEQAYVVTQILEAIYESARTGKAVYFE